VILPKSPKSSNLTQSLFTVHPLSHRCSDTAFSLITLVCYHPFFSFIFWNLWYVLFLAVAPSSLLNAYTSCQLIPQDICVYVCTFSVVKLIIAFLTFSALIVHAHTLIKSDNDPILSLSNGIPAEFSELFYIALTLPFFFYLNSHLLSLAYTTRHSISYFNKCLYVCKLLQSLDHGATRPNQSCFSCISPGMGALQLTPIFRGCILAPPHSTAIGMIVVA